MRVVVSAGGTGGHIYPALAIINKIKSEEPNSEFLYIGTHNRMEKDLIPSLGIRYEEIEITGFIGICKNVERNIVNIDFTAHYVRGELTTSEESTEVCWATQDRARELITFPLTRKRLENMLSERGEAALFCFRRENTFCVTEDTLFPIGK